MKNIVIISLSLISLSVVAAEEASSVPTKASYIQEMDAGCAKAQAEVKPLQKNVQAAHSNADYKAVFEALVKAKKITDALHADQEALPRPAEDSAKLDNYFKVLAQLSDAASVWMESLHEASEAPADQAEAATAKLNELTQEQIGHAKALHEAASKYGFKVCGILKQI